MKKIIFLLLIFFTTVLNVKAEEIKRIIVGNKDAKITIIAFESLTCSHCANFHKNVFPELKKEFLDTGVAKIEFRHFPLDIAAFNASKVAQCKNDGNSDILESLYANQQKWVKGSSIQEANKNLQKFLKNEGFNFFKKEFMKIDINLKKPNNLGMGSYTIKLKNNEKLIKSGSITLPHGYFYAAKKNK